MQTSSLVHASRGSWASLVFKQTHSSLAAATLSKSACSSHASPSQLASLRSRQRMRVVALASDRRYCGHG